MDKTICVNARFLTQPITGVQRFAIEIAKQLSLIYKENIKFVSPHNVLHKDLAEQLKVQMIGKREGHVWEQIDLPLYLRKQNKPLLLNLANTGPAFYKNQIITIHDVAFNVYPETYNKTFLYLYKVLIPSIIKNSEHIITVSKFSKNEIKKYYNVADEKISVVYNAVEEEFQPEKKSNFNNEDYFLAVSSVNFRKNLLNILKAFDSLSSDYSNLKLFLIGDLTTKSFAKVDFDKYLDNKNIKILGRVSDKELIQYYSNAIAFVYPSLYEGFGIPPLEAQHCGCPAIVSNSSCLPEIFDDSVLYCDPFSVQSVNSCMQLIVDDIDLRKTLVNKGRENSMKYSWKKSAKAIDEIIKRSCK